MSGVSTDEYALAECKAALLAEMDLYWNKDTNTTLHDEGDAEGGIDKQSDSAPGDMSTKIHQLEDTPKLKNGDCVNAVNGHSFHLEKNKNSKASEGNCSVAEKAMLTGNLMEEDSSLAKVEAAQVKMEETQGSWIPRVQYQFSQPELAVDFKEEFMAYQENFTKGCKWSPDGACLLTASEDKQLRIFNIPPTIAQGKGTDPNLISREEKQPALVMREGELVYDYAWYPNMLSTDTQSCCFIVTSRDHPVHLWDAWYGKIVCSYVPYNHLDQMVACHSVNFTVDGNQILCGFKDCIRIFDTSRPGRQCTTMNFKESHPGIVSCMVCNPQLPSLCAAATYKGSIGLFNMKRNNLFCRLEGHKAGITHLAFSSDGSQLFSGTRKDSEILCWDIRNPGQVLFVIRRDAATSQRIYFDVDHVQGHYLVSGTSKGEVHVWDTLQAPVPVVNDDAELKPVNSFTAHNDCVNGISLHPYLPLLATSSGQRHFPEPNTDSEESDPESESASKPLFTAAKMQRENTVKMWWVGSYNTVPSNSS